MCFVGRAIYIVKPLSWHGVHTMFLKISPSLYIIIHYPCLYLTYLLRSFEILCIKVYINLHEGPIECVTQLLNANH